MVTVMLLEASIGRFPAQKLSHFCAIVDLGNAHSCQLLVKSEKKNKLKYLSINTLTPRKSDFYFVLPREQPFLTKINILNQSLLI